MSTRMTEERTGTPLKLREFRLSVSALGAADGVLVMGRMVGENLIVHRCSARFEEALTTFTVSHVPTGTSIVVFTSEKYALHFAEDMLSDLGEAGIAALGTEKADRVKSAHWSQMRKAAEATDLWPLELIATSSQPFQISLTEVESE